MQTLVEQFTLERVQKGGGAFNDDKLDWVNREQLKLLSSEEFWAVAESFVPEQYRDTAEKRAVLRTIEHQIRERIVNFSDMAQLFEAGEFDYFFFEPVVDAAMIAMIVWKALRDDADGFEKTKVYLQEAARLLGTIPEDEWQRSKRDAIGEALLPYAEQDSSCGHCVSHCLARKNLPIHLSWQAFLVKKRPLRASALLWHNGAATGPMVYNKAHDTGRSAYYPEDWRKCISDRRAGCRKKLHRE